MRAEYQQKVEGNISCYFRAGRCVAVAFVAPPQLTRGKDLTPSISSVRILGVAGAIVLLDALRTVFFLFAIKNDRWLSMVCGCLVWSPLRSLPAKETVGVLLGGAK